jgi:3-phosphoshikimate 1-carboxyvinyltransferase
VKNGSIEIEGQKPLLAKPFTVPGDLSSAAFLVAAALGVHGSSIRLNGVGVNPTRSGFLNLLQDSGARIALHNLSSGAGEPAADLLVESSDLTGIDIGARWVPNVIDEIPVLAVLGTRTRDGVRIREAEELRAKESDRIRSVAANLRALGVDVEEFADGLFVRGNQTIRGGRVDSFGDHRIAMAFAVAACFATGPVTIENASCAAISFPGFFEMLERLKS